MEHGAHFAAWAPVLGIALIIACGGVIFAVASLRAGQYKDPEAAKFALSTGDETYPAAAEEAPV